jgi:hypothetical protein
MTIPSMILPALALLSFAATPARAGMIAAAPAETPRPVPAGPVRRAAMAPLKSIHAYVCGLHFYNGEPQRQVLAHHFCAHVDGDLMQCVIYDSNRPGARLIGIEYVLTARRYRTLPPEEQRLWHSHAYEVKSGLLAAPNLGDAAERAFMKDFASTYGKTFHTWQVDRDPLPLGIPKLMMGFTADGQADPMRVQERDRAVRVPAETRRRQRAGLPDPIIEPNADAWRTGSPMQLALEPVGPPKVEQIPMH